MAFADPLARLQRYDAWLCLRMNRALRYTLVPQFFRLVSWLGNGIFWYALMLSLLVRQRAEAAPAVLHMSLVGIVCTLAYRALKRGTVRMRPYQAVQGVAVGAVPLDRFSFPSGHTLHAVAFTIVAGSYYPALALPLAVFTVLTAISRVVLGLHYPSDVLAGALIGAAVAGLSLGI
ncbi:MAG: phosphatase PAP2 family protein [Betaproteobacteria bacterium]|nr:phosphatase PAP2 family protein [Betaproteobacteria bacterium]